MFRVWITVAVLAPGALAAIADDFSCTDYTSYTSSATVCSNIIDDSACAVFYKESAQGVGFPAPGNQVQRPFACYSTSPNGGSVSADMKKAAINNCPKTCGFCCLTPAYNCSNAQFPAINCATVTQSQCTNPIWREQIAQNCPSVCGFCNEGGCVDAVADCANDLSICTNMNMQPFANEYCKKTCGRCTASPSNPTNPGTPGCTSYKADSATACAAWAANGFCTNDFYTKEQRKAYCATTCKIC